MEKWCITACNTRLRLILCIKSILHSKIFKISVIKVGWFLSYGKDKEIKP